MKYAIFIYTLLVGITAYTCNQRTYDKLYKAIVQDSMTKDADDHETYVVRNKAITTLRELCNGQKSTWERGTSGAKDRDSQ